MEYIKSELGKFERIDFWPGQQWKEAATVFLSWAAPAFFFVLGVKYFEAFRTVEYYKDAISQGIGPKLWNVIGAFGFAFFGLSLVFTKTKAFSYIANRILINVYAIGSLTFGLLLGQFVCLIPELDQYLDGWRLYLFTPLSAVLLTAVAIINLGVWYLSYLIQWKGNFHQRVGQIHLMLRIFIGCATTSIPIWLLWIER